MSIKPFLKWAGGKRWIVGRQEFQLPAYSGRYIEPFLGGAAVFFHHGPKRAVLSDINVRLIETYQAIKSDWQLVWQQLQKHQKLHSRGYYYEERKRTRRTLHTRAAQFLYLNRACWNGLYRENLRGEFNVPIGTKSRIIFDTDNFEVVSDYLQNAEVKVADFADTMSVATDGDLIFVDPPYTTAHNFNGFIKYNQNIFSWNDQIRLQRAVVDARARGATIVLTNAAHPSIRDLYKDVVEPVLLDRHSVIAGSGNYRLRTAEFLYVIEP